VIDEGTRRRLRQAAATRAGTTAHQRSKGPCSWVSRPTCWPGCGRFDERQAVGNGEAAPRLRWPILARLHDQALAGRPTKILPPPGIVIQRIDRATARLRARQDANTIYEVFRPTIVPTEVAPVAGQETTRQLLSTDSMNNARTGSQFRRGHQARCACWAGPSEVLRTPSPNLPRPHRSVAAVRQRRFVGGPWTPLQITTKQLPPAWRRTPRATAVRPGSKAAFWSQSARSERCAAERHH